MASRRRFLRLFHLWLGIGWLLVALVVYLSVFSIPHIGEFRASDKIGHVLAYFALMFWFAQLYTDRSRLMFGAGFLAMGIALEFVQGATALRSFEVLDMGANGLGVISGWLLAATPLSQSLVRVEALLGVNATE